MSQIGIHPTELGTIYCLIFFITFFKNIVVGFIADKYQLHKLILILSCVLTGPLYATFLALPSVKGYKQIVYASSVNLTCALSSSVNITSPNTLTLSDGLLVTCLPPSTSCDQRRGHCLNSTSQKLNFTSQICGVSCVDISDSTFHTTTGGINNPHGLITYASDDHMLATGAGTWPLRCTVSYDGVYETKKPPPYSSFTFWLGLAIGLLAALCGSNELMMNDAIAISLLGTWMIMPLGQHFNSRF